jgi:hypothetical protein
VTYFLVSPRISAPLRAQNPNWILMPLRKVVVVIALRIPALRLSSCGGYSFVQEAAYGVQQRLYIKRLAHDLRRADGADIEVLDTGRKDEDG